MTVERDALMRQLRIQRFVAAEEAQRAADRVIESSRYFGQASNAEQDRYATAIANYDSATRALEAVGAL